MQRFKMQRFKMQQSSFTIIIVVLLIVGQMHSVVHAAEFGGDLHYHGDHACLLAPHEDEYDPIGLPQDDECVLTYLQQTPIHLPRPVFCSSLIGLLPPPHGPPYSRY